MSGGQLRTQVLEPLCGKGRASVAEAVQLVVQPLQVGLRSAIRAAPCRSLFCIDVQVGQRELEERLEILVYEDGRPGRDGQCCGE